MASGKPDQVSGLIRFRHRDTMEAMYFDGSLECAIAIGNAFPGDIQIEMLGGGQFVIAVKNQAAYIPPHNWCYKNGNGRLEWRDTEELNKRWEQLDGTAMKPPAKRKK